MNRYDMVKKNIIYEENIYYKKNGKQYIGCLVRSKYADDFDQIEFYLFENKSTRNLFLCLDLIEYDKIERSIEQKKDTGWISSRSQKILFYFELTPKHQQQKEIFAVETEENRIEWIKIISENITKLNTHHTYECNSDDKELSDEEEKTEVKSKPAIPPRSFTLKDIEKKLSRTDLLRSQSAVIQQLQNVLVNPKKQPLNNDEIFYRGSFEQLEKILRSINKAGVYAVSSKIQPESDCTLAIRVYENARIPLSSWNIYQTQKTNEYFLFEDDLTFSTILDLCSYYTENDLPSESSTINRLTFPYKHFLK